MVQIHASHTIKPRPITWYRKPGGSVHAFQGIRTVCERFWFQASWEIVDVATVPLDDRCGVCHDMLNPTEAEQRVMDGNR